jgi:hypothetical protein
LRQANLPIDEVLQHAPLKRALSGPQALELRLPSFLCQKEACAADSAAAADDDDDNDDAEGSMTQEEITLLHLFWLENLQNEVHCAVAKAALLRITTG